MLRAVMRSAKRHIPSFALYGEQNAGVFNTDALHIEDIQSRSRKYLWRIATHRHTGLCQCIVVLSGPVAAELEDQRTDLAGPAAVVVPSGAVHAFKFGADTVGYVLSVDIDRLLSTAAATRHLPIQRLFASPRLLSLSRDTDLANRLGNQLKVLAEEYRQPDSVHSPVCTWLASSILAVLAHGSHMDSEVGTRAGADGRLIREFRRLIEANHLRHWPVARYAARLGVSETSLNRLCRRQSGTTAFALIQQRLALEAKRRLMYVAASVQNIASELGFADPAYFSRFFRRHCGLSPQDYRRRQSGG
jgi:AraC family transcriptional activator of pobA